MFRGILILVVLGIVGLSTEAKAQLKTSGYLFGDYTYIIQNHDTNLVNLNGFWIRRIYFTVDKEITKEIKTRFRLEANIPDNLYSVDGKFADQLKVTPYVKDAYIYLCGSYIGLSPTPTFNLTEDIWGLRHVEKTPQDLFKIQSSRGLGLAYLGKFNMFRVHFMVSNINRELLKDKLFYLALSVNPIKELYLEVYGDYKTDGKLWTGQGFLGYKTEKYRAGLLFTHQERKKNETWTPYEINSLFGYFKINEKVGALARIDREPKGNFKLAKNDYLPIAEGSPLYLGILGLEYKYRDDIHIIPNVQMIMYDKEEIKDDLLFRITLYYKF